MLHELALEKKLPKHQFMDQGTLDWIVQTGESMLGTSHPNITLSQYLKPNLHLASPSEDFFTDKPIAHGIHGYRHCARVSLLATHVYATQTKEPRLEIVKTLMVAGSLHDCRRLDDNADSGHGPRGVEWLADNQDSVADWFKLEPFEANFKLAGQGIYYHETPSSDIPEMHEDEKLVIDIIKTADALDRYRQPIEKWWINDSYLNIKPSPELKAMAWRMVCLSEANYLNSQNNQSALQSVLEICEYA